VDHKLRGDTVTPEVRMLTAEGTVEMLPSPKPYTERHGGPRAPREEARWGEYEGYIEEMPAVSLSPEKQIYIYPYGVARNKLERAIAELGLSAIMARRMEDADVIIAVKQQERRDSGRLAEAVHHGVPVHVIRANTYQQIVGALHELYRLNQNGSSDTEAIQEARTAINEVLSTSRPIELSPRNAYQRRLQHKMANQYHLNSESIGTEPMRHVRIYK